MIRIVRYEFRNVFPLPFLQLWGLRIIYFGIPIYYFSAFAFFGILKPILSKDLSAIANALNNQQIVIPILAPGLTLLALFFTCYLVSMKKREATSNLLDILLVILYMLGFVHIFIAIYSDGSFFNALAEHRYHFSMILFYFLTRYFVQEKRQLRAMANIAIIVFFAAGLFTQIESFCINCLQLPTSKLPWAGVLFQTFEYAPDIAGKDAFITAKAPPMGIMYMQHLSGLFLVLGFGLFLPTLFLRVTRLEGWRRWVIILLVGFLPMGVLFTSKTTLICYFVSIFLVAICMIKQWRRAVFIIPTFCILLPALYSYYLLPCMRYDFFREMSYILARHTSVNEKKHIDEGPEARARSGESVETKIELQNFFAKGFKKKIGFGCVYCKNATDRTLTNAFTSLIDASFVDALELTKGMSKNAYAFFFGHGYGTSDWTHSLIKEQSKKSYDVVSHSDNPYLKFFEQFGIIGLILLLMIGVISILMGYIAFLNAHEVKTKAATLGLTVVVAISYLAMMHLQVFFKTGINTVFFTSMALVVFMFQIHRKSYRFKLMLLRPLNVMRYFPEFFMYLFSFGPDISFSRKISSFFHGAMKKSRKSSDVGLFVEKIQALRPLTKSQNNGVQKGDSGIGVSRVNWNIVADDPEEYFRLHRFGWLLSDFAEGKYDQRQVDNYIYDWLCHCPLEVGKGWDSYSVSERISNWCLLLNNHKILDDKLLVGIKQHLYFLAEHLEVRGSATNNHLFNNGRAIFIGGIFVKDERLVKLGKEIIAYCLEKMFYPSGMLREGSSHYQVLMARTILEIIWWARKNGDEEFAKKYETIAEKIWLAASLFFKVEDFPYIGDTSPDYHVSFHKDIVPLGAVLLGKALPVNSDFSLRWYKLFTDSPVPALEPYQYSENLYKDAGIFYVEKNEFQVFAHVNPLNHIPTWSHAHNDAGSFLLYKKQSPVFISANRLTYFPNAIGQYGRSISSKCGIKIDNHEPQLAHGHNALPEIMTSAYFGPIPQCKIVKSEESTDIYITIKNFARCCGDIIITRIIRLDNECTIIDEVNGEGKHLVNTFFHLPKNIVRMIRDDHVIETVHGIFTIQAQEAKIETITRKGKTGFAGHYSPSYGVSDSCTSIVITQKINLPKQNRYKFATIQR